MATVNPSASNQQAYYPTMTSKKLEDEQAAMQKQQMPKQPEAEEEVARCCCCKLTTGAVTIGVVELVLLVLLLASSIVTYVLTETTVASWANRKPKDGQETATESADQQLEAFITTTLLPEDLSSGTDMPKEQVQLQPWLPYGAVYSDYNWVYGQNPLASLAVGVGAAVLGIVVVAMMLAGVRKCKPGLLVPHMICHTLGVLALFAGIGLFIYAAVTVSSSKSCTSEASKGDTCTKILLSFGGFIAVFAFFACLQIYFFIVIIKCYRALKEKSRLTNLKNPYQQYQAAANYYAAMYQQQLQQQQQMQQQQAHGGQQAAGAPIYQQPLYATYANPYGVGLSPYGSYGYRYA